jgi:hydroxymethyl cephem carbamoyltransferase
LSGLGEENRVLIVSFKPGHDGAVAVIQDSRLLFSLEPEKDSHKRYSPLTPTTLIDVAQQLGGIPDVIAVGGWHKRGSGGWLDVGTGYSGIDKTLRRKMNFMGKQVEYFSSSHERSHLLMAIGMAKRSVAPLRTVLVWEGLSGSFYLMNDRHQLVKSVKVLTEPGSRYAFLYSLADPAVPDRGARLRMTDSGKLMALAAFGDARAADTELRRTVQEILSVPSIEPTPKWQFRHSPVYNSGVASGATKIAAALLTERIFGVFAKAAVRHLPPGTPLNISGGCGLNCEWNERWRQHKHFSSVFVPPCANDSGSAIGTAIDAQYHLTGDPHITWDVYSGLPFDVDTEPDPRLWARNDLNYALLAASIASGEVIAWVQGRWEIGPRALGNRSLLAEPFNAKTRDRLNEIKHRESYRPIAPCCRVEDLSEAFDQDFEDPYMLYFRRVKSSRLAAITHVDGSARVQTVRRGSNRPLHELLSAFSAAAGVGVLCNTSLNFGDRGFINRMSDLVPFCETRGINHLVVGGIWYRRL